MTARTALNLAADRSPTGSAAAADLDTARIVAAIVAPRQAIEQAFLAMGDGLMAGARLLNDISGAHKAMATEFESDDFLNAVDRIEALRREVADIVAGISTGDAEIARLAETTKKLGVPLEETESAIRLLGLVAVNARIVAAAIETDQSDLVAFTDEMMGIAREAKQAVTSISEVHDRVRRTVAATKKTQTDFSKDHARTMAAIAAQLDDDLRTIERQRVQAAEHAGKSAALAGAIGARIGDAVAAMQVGDMTRQRLEHIEDMIALIGDRGGEWQDETNAVIRHIAAAQLISTDEDFASEVDGFLSALQALRGDAEQVLQDGTERAGRTLADSSDALAALAADLQSLGPLLREDAENRRTARMLSEGATDAMQQMLHQIDLLERTEHDVRLLGLNMAIRCSSLGERASGLRVIAKELSGVARDTSDAATRVRQLLDGAQDTIAAARRRAAEFEGRDLTDEPTAAAHRLEAMLDRLKENARTLGTACPEAVDILHDTAERARRVATSGVDTAPLVGQLRIEGEDPDATNAEETVLADIRGTYTMQKERRIHDGICGIETPEEETADTVFDEDDLDDFLL